MSGDIYLQARDLHKSFGGNHVLRGVSLDVERGESLVILGGSGAGKSVLMRHLVGLHRPDRGEVVIDGVSLASLDRGAMRQFRRKMGMTFQEGALFDSLTVFENIAFPLRRHQRGMSQKDITKRVEECLEMVGMPTVGKLLPSELSGGMRRRVGFARGIALKPEFLLFDEPTTGLDPIMTTIIGEIIVHLRESLKATTVTITHDIGSAEKIATKVAMLFKGQVIFQAPTDAFFESDDPIVRQFVRGEPDGPATEALLK